MKRFTHFFIRFREFDWILILVAAVLTAVGLSAIYSIDLSRGERLQYFPTQFVAALLGVAALFAAGIMHRSMYRSAAPIAYAAAFILLGLVLVFGTTIRGTTGWFRIGGASFQPAELAKAGLILFLGWWMERHKRRFQSWQFVFTSGVAAMLLAGLILLQPDAGSAFILGLIWFGLLLLSGTKKRYIAILLGLVAVAGVVGWAGFFKEYQKERILTFIHPERDTLGAGYNVAQSVIAVGSGQFFGRGLGFGSQSQLHFLPEAQTDFIFSVIAEELGFLGAGTVVALYSFLVYRLVRIALLARDDFSAYAVLGIALLFAIHFFVNVGGALGLLPVTGVTLPFVSYGGSSLLVNFALLGVAESIARAGARGKDDGEDTPIVFTGPKG